MKISEDHIDRYQRIHDAIHEYQDNDLMLILNSHILLEHELVVLIENKLKNTSAIREIMRSYPNKVDLAISQGLSPELKPALRYVGELRNRFAHRLDQKITEADAEMFRQKLPPEISAVAEDLPKISYKIKIKGTDGNKFKWKDATPLIKVGLSITALWYCITEEHGKLIESMEMERDRLTHEVAAMREFMETNRPD